jgi:hypothetical protein
MKLYLVLIICRKMQGAGTNGRGVLVGGLLSVAWVFFSPVHTLVEQPAAVEETLSRNSVHGEGE